MKFLFLLFLVSLVSCNASTTPTSAETAVAKVDVKNEEDCDDKAKKKIEIKEETISLTGNTGCSLEEASVKPYEKK